jgi:hypothetical protein
VTHRRAVGWLIGLLVVVVILVVADRVSAAVAGNVAQRYLAQQAAFESSPSVSIKGFPFLTQAVEGRYGDVEVRSDGPVTIDGIAATNVAANLHGVHLPLSSVFGGTVSTLPIDSVNGSVTFSYSQVATLTHISGLAIADQGGQLHVSAEVAIPGLNVTGSVSGTAAVTVTNSMLRLSVSQLSVAGLSVPAGVLQQLATTLAAPIALPALPYGLQVDAVTPQPDGLVVVGSAVNVVLSSAGTA